MKVVLIVIFTIVAIHPLYADDLPEVCKLPAFKGPCTLELKRWYHDIDARKCKKFIYGGCQTNGNMFKTIIQCKRRCNLDDY